MSINVSEVDGGFRNDCQLNVAVSGLEVIVSPGTVLNYGVERELGEEKRYTVTPSAENNVLVEVWLVVVKATDALDILVDEVEDDGVDVRYVFDDESPYKKLRLIAYGDVPAGVVALDEVEWFVKKIAKREPVQHPQPRDIQRVVDAPVVEEDEE